MPLANDRQSNLDPCSPLVIAHRGASGLAPENTLAAFKLAVALGADGVEMDTHLSADGTPVVIHDVRVNRTTDGSGSVARLTLEQLKELDAESWFERRLIVGPRVRAMARRLSAETGDLSRTVSRETVPTLEVVLALVAPAGLERIYVELKGSRANRKALLEAVLSIVRAIRLEHKVTLLSFDHSIVRSAKEIAGNIRTAATFPAKGRTLISKRSIVRAAESAGVDEVALHFGLVSRRAVDAFHERGLSVSAWTVNSKLAMRRLAACGVDSIMTNFPNRLREVLSSPYPRATPEVGQRRRYDGKR